jgi:hypothetical protein
MKGLSGSIKSIRPNHVFLHCELFTGYGHLLFFCKAMQDSYNSKFLYIFFPQGGSSIERMQQLFLSGSSHNPENHYYLY